MAVHGLSESAWDARVSPSSMSPREQIGHLSECYHAAMEMMAGREYAWGSWTTSESTSTGLMAQWQQMRDHAVGEALREDATPKARQSAIDYIVLHDAYHVGQLVLIRIETDPGFDPYSIYSPEPADA